MNMEFNIRKIIREEVEKIAESDIYYHGTSSFLPFQNFDNRSDGSGIVTSGGKYGGFFFTSEYENANFYTEWLVCKVKINGVSDDPTESTHPPTVMRRAITDNAIYRVGDVFDGAMHSDVVVVPHSKLGNVHILDWEFVGEKESYFEYLDEVFASGDEDNEEFVTKYDIESFVEAVELDMDYVLKLPEFKEYYESKESG